MWALGIGPRVETRAWAGKIQDDEYPPSTGNATPVT